VGAPAGASVTQQQLVQVQAQGGDGLSQGGAEKKRLKKDSKSSKKSKTEEETKKTKKTDKID